VLLVVELLGDVNDPGKRCDATYVIINVKAIAEK
jgi:hypothetical protein